MIRPSLLAVAALTVLAACGSHSGSQAQPSQSKPQAIRASSAIENGRLIYQTGKDIRGVQITARPPALFPRCAACHGANGAGGMKLPGGAVSADLRHKALVTDQKHPYTVALLQRAISTGIDDDGEQLNRVMPRWRLSPRDLHDVSVYVLTQLH